MFMNEVFLQGFVVNTPELRHTQKGVPVTNFTIKTIETHRNKETGESQKIVNYHKCVAWGNNAKRSVNLCNENAVVNVKGSLSNHKYEKKNGDNPPIAIMNTEVKVNSIQIINKPQPRFYKEQTVQEKENTENNNSKEFDQAANDA